MSAATSSRSCATSSRSASGWCKRGASARRLQAKAEAAAEERMLDALVGPDREPADPRQLPQEAARRRTRRQGDRDRAGRQPRRRHADVRDAQHARRLRRRDQPRRHVRQGLRGRGGKTRRTSVRDAYRAARGGRRRQAARPGRSWCREAIREVENNGIVFLDEIDKICAREGRCAADVSREGVQRDLLPLIEGTTVDDQAWAGEDRPRPVHRLGRLPRLEARPTCCRNCRAGCRSASSCAADEEDFRRILTETEASLLKQYRGADADGRA